MGTLAAKLLQDMQDTFLNTNEFAETVSYLPTGGSSKTIAAIVERAPIAPMEQAGRAYGTKNVQIWISRDPTIGVAVVTARQDRVSLKAKLTDSADTTYIVKKLMDHDPGGWHLECEA